MAVSMSASLGLGFVLKRAAAVISCPGWQKPHWGTSPSIQASRKASATGPFNPSIVVISFPTTSLTERLQERVTSPSTCTVQAPHSSIPQLYFTPVNSSCSRSTQSKGVSGSTSSRWIAPFTRIVSICHHLLFVWIQQSMICLRYFYTILKPHRRFLIKHLTTANKGPRPRIGLHSSRGSHLPAHPAFSSWIS